MAINPATEWGAASDPFIMATALVLANFTTADPDGFGRARRIDFDITGALDVVCDDPDVQEIVLKNTAAPFEERVVDEFRLDVAHDTEFYDHEWATNPQGLPAKRAIVPLIGADTATAASVSIDSFEGSGDTIALAIRTAYAWKEKDPAQLITAWLQHYVRTTLALEDYMDEDTFVAASADFDSYDQLKMSAIREVGASIMDQVRKCIRQTVDYLGTRPNETTGAVTMHYIRRDLAVQRDLVIDLDNDTDVGSWTSNSDESFTIDAIAWRYGHHVRRRVEAIRLSAAQGKTWDYESPMDLASTENRDVWTRRASGDELKWDFPWVVQRRGLERHVDMGMWAHEQEEIEFQHGPRHYNYEIGDVVKVTCAALGYNETRCLVVEKDLNVQTHTCRTTVRRVYGYAGARPHRVYGSDLLLWYKAETLGRQPHNNPILRASSAWTPPSQQQTRLRDLANGWDAVIDSTDPDEPLIITDEFPGVVINDWSALQPNSGGLAIPDAAQTVPGNLALIMVGRCNPLIGLQDTIAIHAGNGVLVADFTAYLYRIASAGATVLAAGGYNPAAALTYGVGSWHTWALCRGPASIREDGVRLVTGSSPAQASTFEDEAFLHSSGAGAGAFGSQAATEYVLVYGGSEVLDADLELIEEYLREKYRHY